MLRRLILSASLLLVAVPLSAQDAAKAKKPKKEVKEGETPKAADLKPLFKSTEPLELSIATDLKAFMKTRERGLPTRAGVMSLKNDAGQATTIPVQLGTRGNFRLSSRNCAFPPVRLVLPDSGTKGTAFSKQKRLKLVTRCQFNDEYDQYILQEYMLYRVYNLLTPLSFHARLAKVTYTDNEKKQEPVVSWAFLLEDDGDVAKRIPGELVDEKGALWDDLEPESTRLMSVFEYFIGNTDWSTAGLHNVKLTRDGNAILRPVAYDLDWSGVIGARYARPDPRLPIRDVRQRLYRGPCMKAEEIAPIVAIFNSKKAEIYQMYDDFKLLTPDNLKRTKEYFDDFYSTINDQKKLKREILENCQEKGN